jgi:hypothetical protein
MAGCQLNKLFALAEEKWVCHYDESADAVLNHRSESRLKFTFSAGSEHL